MGKLLVIADEGDSCIATSRGLQLAAKLGHDVEVVAFEYEPLDRIARKKSEQASLKRALLDRREEQVQARINKFKTPKQKVSLRVVWMEHIHSWVNRRASKVKFECVVKTGKQSGGLTYTSTDWHLLRETAAPVLITSVNRWHKTKPVLAALDLGTRNRDKQALNGKILAYAKGLANTLGVELKIISAIEVPTLLADLDLVDPIAYTKEHREELMPHLKSLASTHDVSEKDFKTKRGPVDKVIVSYAARVRAQIVVLGTVARQGLSAAIIGNTAEEVLQHLRTDVLALKADE
ncbi:MAG: universal stress protein [Pseudomonadota bacterium]